MLVQFFPLRVLLCTITYFKCHIGIFIPSSILFTFNTPCLGEVSTRLRLLPKPDFKALRQRTPLGSHLTKFANIQRQCLYKLGSYGNLTLSNLLISTIKALTIRILRGYRLKDLLISYIKPLKIRILLGLTLLICQFPASKPLK